MFNTGKSLIKFEASQAKKMAICNCGVAEIITPQKEGIILEEPSDSEAMAKAIDYLMDSKTREPMRQSARLLAEKFTQERNASEMLQIYQELIENQ